MKEWNELYDAWDDFKNITYKELRIKQIADWLKKKLKTLE